MSGQSRVILAFPQVAQARDIANEWVPYALMTIASKLVDSDVVLFDQTHQDLSAWSDLLLEQTPISFIGFSVMTGGEQISNALRMATVANELVPDVPRVFGGPHVNVLPEQTASHGLVSVALAGPGQTSAPQYLRALNREIGFDEVPGLFAHRNGQWVRGPHNPPRTDRLQAYPWHLVNPGAYVHSNPAIGSKTLNYVASQGCTYKCRFCYELTYNGKLSRMTADAMLDEIGQLVTDYGINGLKFYDADWFIDLKRAAEFAQGLLDRGIRINWAASINPNDVLKAQVRHPDLLSLLAKSGCVRLLMGVESGNDRVLKDIIRKEVTRADILNAAKQISDVGIRGSYTFIIGFPGETADEKRATLDFVSELWQLPNSPETRVHVYTPYPGTPLYAEALAYGFRPPTHLEAWKDCDYYKSHTPWTTPDDARLARAFSRQTGTTDHFLAQKTH